MKICTKCHIDKSDDSFSFKNKAAGTRHAECKACHCVHNRGHYRRNRQYYIDKAKNRKEEALLYLFEYLESHPCPCGETNPILLDFDHIDRTTKIMEVAKMARRSWSLPKVKAEIAKCRVLCIKCHRLRTAKQFGWYKWLTKRSASVEDRTAASEAARR